MAKVTTKKQAQINALKAELRLFEAMRRANTYTAAMHKVLDEGIAKLSWEIAQLEAPDAYRSTEFSFVVEYFTAESGDQAGKQMARMIIFEKDDETGARSVKDILETEAHHRNEFFADHMQALVMKSIFPIKVKRG